MTMNNGNHNKRMIRFIDQIFINDFYVRNNILFIYTSIFFYFWERFTIYIYFPLRFVLLLTHGFEINKKKTRQFHPQYRINIYSKLFSQGDILVPPLKIRN